MHIRERHIEAVLKKRRRIWPILGVLGPRQVGKSTFLREKWCNIINGIYLTLDRAGVRSQFLSESEQSVIVNSEDLKIPLIIDEAQKAPALFDTLKLLADERGVRSFATLSGSVDFSLANGVRESLTGRIGITRMFPFTIREISNLPFYSGWIFGVPKTKNTKNNSVKKNSAYKKVSIKTPPVNAIETWIERGGLPTVCRLSSKDERMLAIEEWIEAVCYKDLKELKDKQLDGHIAKELLRLISLRPDYSKGDFVREIGESSYKIEKHLKALEALFVIYRKRPYKHSAGKDIFTVFDSALAGYFGATRETRLEILFINELLAQYEYSAKSMPNLYYYMTKYDMQVPLIFEGCNGLQAVTIRTNEIIPPFFTRSHLFLKEALPTINHKVLMPIREEIKFAEGLTGVPWDSVL